MFKRIDESTALSKFLERFSNYLARKRGLPVVIGIALLIASFVLQIIDVYSGSRLLELVGVVMHNSGILIALIGLLLAIPLGK
jgi:hypothetical protein